MSFGLGLDLVPNKNTFIFWRIREGFHRSNPLTLLDADFDDTNTLCILTCFYSEVVS